jgi:hypothetical protein
MRTISKHISALDQLHFVYAITIVIYFKKIYIQFCLKNNINITSFIYYINNAVLKSLIYLLDKFGHNFFQWFSCTCVYIGDVAEDKITEINGSSC